MAQRLKRWESPRNQGRNDKGRGGSARQRQIRKQTQMLRKKLKDDRANPNHEKPNSNPGKGQHLFPLFLAIDILLAIEPLSYRQPSFNAERNAMNPTFRRSPRPSNLLPRNIPYRS